MAFGQAGIHGVFALRPVVLVKYHGSGYAATRAHKMEVYIVMFMRRARRSPCPMLRVGLVPTPGTGHVTIQPPPTSKWELYKETLSRYANQALRVMTKTEVSISTAVGPNGAHDTVLVIALLLIMARISSRNLGSPGRRVPSRVIMVPGLEPASVTPRHHNMEAATVQDNRTALRRVHRVTTAMVEACLE
ncbi:hypothetical protein DPMN_170112 [Dreissena polymorpha]|uniref:Uncharacterized protein n=1 Tax=Dreissena polymorpha TaxID=45954 RepID=A0A9D4DY06_DREPO|nr:hypothetical protein DPMN_170112 [Dreissena polymorpha]